MVFMVIVRQTCNISYNLPAQARMWKEKTPMLPNAGPPVGVVTIVEFLHIN